MLFLFLFRFQFSKIASIGENPQEDLAFKGDMTFLENSPNYKTMAKYCAKFYKVLWKSDENFSNYGQLKNKSTLTYSFLFFSFFWGHIMRICQ
jgi:hypothetical protein